MSVTIKPKWDSSIKTNMVNKLYSKLNPILAEGYWQLNKNSEDTIKNGLMPVIWSYAKNINVIIEMCFKRGEKKRKHRNIKNHAL